MFFLIILSDSFCDSFYEAHLHAQAVLGSGAKEPFTVVGSSIRAFNSDCHGKGPETLEAAVREISYFLEADGSGHAPAKYCLREAQWFRVDPYFHLFSWSEQQKVEENLTSALKARGHDFATWVEELSVPQKPNVREAFFRWSSCGMVQAFCWLLLVRIAFQPTKKENVQPDASEACACFAADVPCNSDKRGPGAVC
eukprot:symbB.v1.2.029361.t1/scaffold3202.1/size61359/1